MKDKKELIFIAHRGNVDGPSVERENTPLYINEAIDMGYSVEVDVWLVDNKFWLGHDCPVSLIDERYLENDRLWCHAKNIESLEKMMLNDKIHCFWHQEDDYTITKKGYIWAYPGKELTGMCVCVMPEAVDRNFDVVNEAVSGYCSDYIKRIRDKID